MQKSVWTYLADKPHAWRTHESVPLRAPLRITQNITFTEKASLAHLHYLLSYMLQFSTGSRLSLLLSLTRVFLLITGKLIGLIINFISAHSVLPDVESLDLTLKLLL